jgi:dCMP deaminase
MIRALKRMDGIYMKMAVVMAEASKCHRAGYGSVIVSADGKRISAGYNGKPKDSINDDVCYREGLPPNSPKANCCIHSEVNVIIHTDPDVRKGASMYTSGVPCNDCAIIIMQSGITELIYLIDPIPGGHVGSSNDDTWESYGSKIQRIPFSFVKYYEAFPKCSHLCHSFSGYSSEVRKQG